MFDRIPSELRSLRQWVLHDASKRPYQINGEYADVTSPVTWNSFDAVCVALTNNDRFTGIGFVLSESDTYSIIDLDHTENQEWVARQLKVAQAFDSYSEVSLSGKGLHIIVKGKVQSGARRDKIEIYSSGRYMAMTGNIYNDKPIEDRQELLTQLWNEIKKSTTENVNVNESEINNDEEILRQCRNAVNAEKFGVLYRGQWQDTYPSQSEADYALIDIIAFYTKNRNQIARIFRSSGLGKRDKANRKAYLDGMINKSFDRIVTPIDIAPLQEAIKQKLASVAQLVEPVPHKNFDLGSNPSTSTNTAGSSNGKTTDFESVNEVSTTSPATTPEIPPGLLGEIAKFIYAAAPRPVPEIALAGAIGLMAAICGRAYNVSGSGLNHYLLLLAPTGTGKESMSSGIDKIMSAMFSTSPSSKDFIGPSEIASGQALVRYVHDSLTKTFLCMLDEFGLRLEQMSDPRANDAQRKLKQILLELYQKNGRGQVYRPSIFADKEKNTLSSNCPNVSLLGYSAPERFYAALTEDMIADGLLPRFTIIEYEGIRPPPNYNHHTVFPSTELMTQIQGLVAFSLSKMSSINGQVWVDVSFDEASEKMHKEFNDYCDSLINSNKNVAYKQLWSRAHLKAIKLAALVAIGCNPFTPMIIVDHLEYAIKIVCNDARALMNKFETGLTGKNNEHSEQTKEMIRTLKEYCLWHWNKIKPYCMSNEKEFHDKKIVTKTYLNNRTGKLACFRNDKLGTRGSIQAVLKEMIAMGILIRIPDKIKELYQITENLME